MVDVLQNTFQFELVSPDEVLASESVSSVVVPASEGDIGVLAGHIPLLSALRPGVVSLVTEGGDTRQIFLSGGFVDIGQNLCTVLAEDAVNVKDLQQAEIEQDLINLKEDLALAEDDHQKARIEKKLEIAKAKLTAITGELVN